MPLASHSAEQLRAIKISYSANRITGRSAGACEPHIARLKFHSIGDPLPPHKFYLCPLGDRSVPSPICAILAALRFGYARAAKCHAAEIDRNLSRLSRRSELHINRSNLSVRCRRFVRTRLGVNDGIFGCARSAAHHPHGYRCV